MLIKFVSLKLFLLPDSRICIINSKWSLYFYCKIKLFPKLHFSSSGFHGILTELKITGPHFPHLSPFPPSCPIPMRLRSDHLTRAGHIFWGSDTWILEKSPFCWGHWDRGFLGHSWPSYYHMERSQGEIAERWEERHRILTLFDPLDQSVCRHPLELWKKKKGTYKFSLHLN